MFTYLLAIYWTICVLATHWPLPHEAEVFMIWDKAAHAVMYSGLGLLLGWRLGLGDRSFRAVFYLGIAVLACYGALDELTQPLTGRSTDLLDWGADMLGASVGLVFSKSSLGQIGSRIFGARGP